MELSDKETFKSKYLFKVFKKCNNIDLESENAIEELYNCSNQIDAELDKVKVTQGDGPSWDKLIKVLDDFIIDTPEYIQEPYNPTVEDNTPLIEPFQNTNNMCCPDGHTLINGKCSQICTNCKYNDCEKGSGNIGVYYKEKFGNKAKIHQEMDTEMFNYIVNEIN